MSQIHASRTRYEAFMRCPRYGFLQFHWGNKGIVRTGKNIYLMTGSWLHVGLELIGKWLQQNKHPTSIPEDVLGHIIQEVKLGYFQQLFPKGWFEAGGGFDLISETTDEFNGLRREMTQDEFIRLQQYTYNEQSALVEALLRVFVIRIIPKWMARYRIVTVEKDLSFELMPQVVQSAKVDWVLQEIATKDLFLVSFKGYRQFGAHEAKQASHDTQGLSESWAFDEFLKLKGYDKKIMGVKMVYLIKGARKETKRGSGKWEQQSPLIRGYRKLTNDGPEYAHSWFYPKPENDSGWGAIGRAYEKIDLFQGLGLEELGGVKAWIDMLAEGSIQPENGDILAEQIVEPEVYLRHEQDVRSWLRQTISREQEIAVKLNLLERYDYEGRLDYYLDDNFQQNKLACHYYPGDINDCPYIPVCHGTEEERTNPLANGYEFRTPHHESERLYQISQEKGHTDTRS